MREVGCTHGLGGRLLVCNCNCVLLCVWSLYKGLCYSDQTLLKLRKDLTHNLTIIHMCRITRAKRSPNTAILRYGILPLHITALDGSPMRAAPLPITSQRSLDEGAEMMVLPPVIMSRRTLSSRKKGSNNVRPRSGSPCSSRSSTSNLISSSAPFNTRQISTTRLLRPSVSPGPP